jgi:hypothetical protein
MPNWIPWSHYPGLTLDRLSIVAQLLVNARDGAVDDHRPHTGESSWSLGVRAYERSEIAIISASKTHHWLRVIAGQGGGPSMFVAAIGPHPTRFCHGAPDDIPAKYECGVFPEMQGIFEAMKLDGGLPEDRILRFVVSTGNDLRVTEVELVELNEKTGEPLNRFAIYAANSASNPIVAFTPTAPAKGVVLKAPPVTLKGEKKHKKQDSE